MILSSATINEAGSRAGCQPWPNTGSRSNLFFRLARQDDMHKKTLISGYLEKLHQLIEQPGLHFSLALDLQKPSVHKIGNVKILSFKSAFERIGTMNPVRYSIGLHSLCNIYRIAPEIINEFLFSNNSCYNRPAA